MGAAELNDSLKSQLEQRLRFVQENPDAAVMEYEGKLSADQITIILTYVLEKLNTPEFEAQLAAMQIDQDVKLDKDDTGLPRSLVFYIQPGKGLMCGVLTLSKDQEGEKPPSEERALSAGKTKVHKAIFHLNETKKIARLHAILGDARENETLEEAKKRDLLEGGYDQRYGYGTEREMSMERQHKVLQQEILNARAAVSHQYVATPWLGSPYKKMTEGGLKWAVNVYDEHGITSLEAFHKAFQDGNAVEKGFLTQEEDDQIKIDIAAGRIPSIFRKLVGDLLLGVQALHKADVVHGDLEPKNILLCRDDQGELYLKVIDLGLGAEIKTSQAKMFQPGDVMSCGIVIFNLLHGHVPDLSKDKDLIDRNELLSSMLSSEVENIDEAVTKWKKWESSVPHQNRRFEARVIVGDERYNEPNGNIRIRIAIDNVPASSEQKDALIENIKQALTHNLAGENVSVNSRGDYGDSTRTYYVDVSLPPDTLGKAVIDLIQAHGLIVEPFAGDQKANLYEMQSPRKRLNLRD